MNSAQLTPVISGEAFRRKVRLAIQAWRMARPWEYRQHVEKAKEMRDSLRGSQGYDKERTGFLGCIMPEFVIQALRASEWQSNFQYGVPCGTGNSMWDNDTKLYELALSEMPELRVSSLRGMPRHDRG